MQDEIKVETPPEEKPLGNEKDTRIAQLESELSQLKDLVATDKKRVSRGELPSMSEATASALNEGIAELVVELKALRGSRLDTPKGEPEKKSYLPSWF